MCQSRRKSGHAVFSRMRLTTRAFTHFASTFGVYGRRIVMGLLVSPAYRDRHSFHTSRRNWMFIKTYKDLRAELLGEHGLRALHDLSSGAFEEINPAQVVVSVVCEGARQRDGSYAGPGGEQAGSRI